MSEEPKWMIVDSGIFLASVQKERFGKEVDRLLASLREANFQLAAPTLLRYELIAVVRKNVYRKSIAPSDARVIQEAINELTDEITFFIDDDLLKRGYAIAEQLSLATAYDSQYLSVAERLHCDFWTADERLFNAVKQNLNWVHWIGQPI